MLRLDSLLTNPEHVVFVGAVQLTIVYQSRNDFVELSIVCVLLYVSPRVLLMNELTGLTELLDNIENSVLQVSHANRNRAPALRHCLSISPDLSFKSGTLLEYIVHLLSLEVSILHRHLKFEFLTVRTPLILTLWATNTCRKWFVTVSYLVMGEM